MKEKEQWVKEQQRARKEEGGEGTEAGLNQVQQHDTTVNQSVIYTNTTGPASKGRH